MIVNLEKPTLQRELCIITTPGQHVASRRDCTCVHLSGGTLMIHPLSFQRAQRGETNFIRLRVDCILLRLTFTFGDLV